MQRRGTILYLLCLVYLCCVLGEEIGKEIGKGIQEGGHTGGRGRNRKRHPGGRGRGGCQGQRESPDHPKGLSLQLPQ